MSAAQKELAPAQPLSLVVRFAERYFIEPSRLLPTLKATAFYNADGDVSNEQMMMLLIVADQYRLNPFTREIYAFPDKKKGGIVPIVGIDGWARLVNDQPQFNGVTFAYGPPVENKKGAPEWIECTMYRKDRAHPTVIREWLKECYRDTQPWGTHPARMLRHKAFMQCGRIAFSLVGIYDEDEAQRIIEGESRRLPDDDGVAAINSRVARTIEGTAEVETKPAPAAAPAAASAAAPAKPAPSPVQESRDGGPVLPTPAEWFDRCMKASTSDQLDVLLDLVKSYDVAGQDEMLRAVRARSAEITKP